MQHHFMECDSCIPFLMITLIDAALKFKKRFLFAIESESPRIFPRFSSLDQAAFAHTLQELLF